MTPAELNNKRILVAGLGVSGLSVVRYLMRHALAFDVADERGAEGVRLPPETRVHRTLDVAEAYDVVVLSPGIPRASAAIAAACEAGVTVIGDVELFASVVDQSVVAVTGSNGKSTVVAWLAHALSESGIDALACGNIGEPVLDVLEQPAAVYVLELSSFQLESVTRLQPTVAAVLNVSEDHLDRYDSIEAYAAVKRHIYSGAKRRVLNADDHRALPGGPLGHRDALVAESRFADCDSPSQQPVCWHFATDSRQPAANDDGCLPSLCRDGEIWMESVELSVPGLHNARNALTVLALAECLVAEAPWELDRERLVAAIQAWSGLPHRTALVAHHAGVRWYNDSKGTNVDACIKAIEAMPGDVV